MHIHISCTRNDDNLILLIKTANAHKRRILPQTIIDTCKRYKEKGIQTQSKMIMAAKRWLLLLLQK